MNLGQDARPQEPMASGLPSLSNRSTGKAPYPLSETWDWLCFGNQNASDFTKAVSYINIYHISMD